MKVGDRVRLLSNKNMKGILCLGTLGNVFQGQAYYKIEWDSGKSVTKPYSWVLNNCEKIDEEIGPFQEKHQKEEVLINIMIEEGSPVVIKEYKETLQWDEIVGWTIK